MLTPPPEFDPPAPAAEPPPATLPEIGETARTRAREFLEKQRESAAATPAPAPARRRREWVWFQSTGPAVADVQRMLDGVKVYDRTADEADEAGWYGPATETAVRLFQTQVGLPASGVVDDDTWVALEAASSR